MALTDTAVRLAKPGPKPIKKADDKGLFILIQPSGAKWWRFRYRFGGKEKLLSLGTYPEVTLSQARVKRDQYRALLAQGIDPSDQRKATKDAAADTFAAIALEWHAKHSPTWAPAHAKRVMERLSNHVMPFIGNKPITEITAPMILALLQRMEAAGKLESAHKTKQSIGQVFRYAIATSRAGSDPTPSLKGALPPAVPDHFPALLDPAAIGAALRQFDGYGGYPAVRAGLRLGPLLFCRPGELRTMRWADLDLDACEWRFILSKTKAPQIVPLSRQAMTVIMDLHPLTGRGIYVMPSQRAPKGDRPMSDAAITAAYRSMGIEQAVLVAHGWRATARTLLVEKLKFPADIVEQQLGHVVRDPLGRAYNRTQYLDERKAMMQTWADYLDDLREAVI